MIQASSVPARQETKKIRVLIVDDSPSAANLLAFILSSDPDIQVVGIALTGEDALRRLAHAPVDVVTMDVTMPGMNGFETTRRIMEQTPVPVAIISSLVGCGPQNPFRVLEEGALALLAKPPGPGHPEYGRRAEEIIRTIKTIAEVKVFRRNPLKPARVIGKGAPVSVVPRPGRAPAPRPFQPAIAPQRGRFRLVVLGASTGGPLVIEQIVSQLGPKFPLPILLVQHITAGFTAGFADWIARTTGFDTRVARHGEMPTPGTLYVAPDDVHVGVSMTGAIITDRVSGPVNGSRPSISYLFESAAKALGEEAIGVILSGMGVDGAKELKLIRDRGGVTIAQDVETCVVPSMPSEAARLRSARFMLPPAGISAKLLALARE